MSRSAEDDAGDPAKPPYYMRRCAPIPVGLRHLEVFHSQLLFPIPSYYSERSESITMSKVPCLPACLILLLLTTRRTHASVLDHIYDSIVSSISILDRAPGSDRSQAVICIQRFGSSQHQLQYHRSASGSSSSSSSLTASVERPLLITDGRIGSLIIQTRSLFTIPHATRGAPFSSRQRGRKREHDEEAAFVGGQRDSTLEAQHPWGSDRTSDHQLATD